MGSPFFDGINEYIRGVLDCLPTAIAICIDDRVVYITPHGARLLGGKYPMDIVGQPIGLFAHPKLRVPLQNRVRLIQRQSDTGNRIEGKLKRLDGTLLDVEILLNPTFYENKAAVMLIIDHLTQPTQLSAPEPRYQSWSEHSDDLVCIHNLEGTLLSVNNRVAKDLGYRHPKDLINKNIRDLLVPVFRPRFRAYLDTLKKQRVARGTMVLQTTGGEKRYWNYQNVLLMEHDTTQLVLGTAHDMTELKQAQRNLQTLYQQAKENSQFQEKLLQFNEVLGLELDVANILPILCKETRKLFDVDLAHLWMIDESNSVLELIYADEKQPSNLNCGYQLSLNHPEAAICRVARQGSGCIVNNIPKCGPDQVYHPLANSSGVQSGMAVPLKQDDQVQGVLVIACQENPHRFEQADLTKAILFADQSTQILTRARLHTRAIERHNKLQALHEIDRAINATLDLRVVLDVVLDQVTRQLHLDAACVLLFDPQDQSLEYSAGRGFLNETELSFRVQLGQGLASQVVQERRMMKIPDLNQQDTYQLAPRLARENFAAYYGVPLFAKAQRIGVLELFHRKPLNLEPEGLSFLETMAIQAAIAIENAQLYESTTQAERDYRVLFENAHDAILVFRPEDEVVLQVNQRACDMYGYDRDHFIGMSLKSISKEVALGETHIKETSKIGIYNNFETIQYRKNRDEMHLEINASLIDYKGKPAVLSINRDITERKMAEEELIQLNTSLKSRNREQGALLKISSSLSEQLDLHQIYSVMFHEIAQNVFDAPHFIISRFDEEGETIHCGFAVVDGKEMDVNEFPTMPLGEGPVSQVIRTREPLIVDIPSITPSLEKRKRALWVGEGKKPNSAIYLPLICDDKTLGVMCLQHYEQDAFCQADFKFLSILAGYASVAIKNAQLFEETKHRLNQLHALHTMDKTISSTLDLNITLSVLIDQVTSQLNVHAVDVFLLNPNTATLECVISRGFHSDKIQESHLHSDAEYIGQAILDQRSVYIPDLAASADLSRKSLLQAEQFVSYYGIPLIAKGQTIGLLEIFYRIAFDLNQEKLSFLEALANQAAIAIDNVNLFKNLQRSNIELAMAYDSTLEGWVKALDLRDKETKGHSERVTKITVKLARALGMDEQEMIHVRRGALLHDIGKMAVKDAILQKPGKLTDKEWKIMRNHPVYAFEWLRSIKYLAPALEIPYCHHEKWDGTGYPRGLKRDEIPLAARAFAVVDVWDALISERPYRKAWPQQKVMAHIREQAGTHFDPYIVEAFLELQDFR